MKKRFLALSLSLALACSACALTACGEKGDDNTGTTETQAYVSLDINPSIELIVDKDNKVISVRGENEDGQVLLYQETGIKGEKIDDAISKITALAVEYGYLDENNKVVDTIVSSGDNEFASEILSKVNTTITATAQNSGLSVTTDMEGAYSLLRKMEEVKKQFPNNTAIQNMSVSKFKLALSVSETGEISLETAVTMDDAELIEILKNASLKIEEYATEAYNEVKAKALAVYDEATSIVGYKVYNEFYLEKMLSHPTTSYYGAVYQMYASASKGFGVVCDVAELVNKVSNYPLSNEQIDEVVNALGMESSEELKNSKGKITVESIEAYADKLFKNTPASETLEQMKTDLSLALSQTETAIKEKVNQMTAEYRTQVESASVKARQTLETVKTAMANMPDLIKNTLNTATKDLEDILDEVDAIIESGEVKLDELKEKVTTLEGKATEYLNRIKQDLSDEEWTQLENRQKTAIASMSEQKAIFESALDDAAKIAKDYLANLKNAVKNKSQS